MNSAASFLERGIESPCIGEITAFPCRERAARVEAWIRRKAVPAVSGRNSEVFHSGAPFRNGVPDGVSRAGGRDPRPGASYPVVPMRRTSSSTSAT